MGTYGSTPTFAVNTLRLGEDGSPERLRYERGTGPFLFNRSMRRGFTGVEGRHDASKKPTPGRRSRSGWRGA